MSAAFTPGPWEWSATDNERHAVVSPPVDAENDFGPWFTAIISCQDEAVEDANARLIAAAPELYEVLTKARQKVDHLAQMMGGRLEETLLVRTIDAALAKARGETL